MSDLYTSEFEDYLWDEFLCGDEHEVPYHSFEQHNQCFLPNNRCNKFLSEVTGISSDSEYGSVSGESNQRRSQDGYSTLSNHQSTMLGKGARCRKHDMISSLDIDDFVEETSGVAFESSRSSCNGFKSSRTSCYKGREFSVNDVHLHGGTPRVDKNSFHHSPGDVNPTVKSLDFLENTDSDDYFNDVWPVIGNFEDVNSMFRSCDSTFGIGIDKEDEIDFFSLGDDNRECGGLMKPSYKFPCSADSKTMENTPKNSDSSKNYPSLSSAPSSFDALSAIGADEADGSDGFTASRKEVGLDNAVHPRPSVDAISKTNSDGVMNDDKKQFVKLNQSDDITQKAASFLQLQLVTEWLDLNTKLRIRDGLYRLARGVEYRNRHARLSGELGFENFSGGSSYMTKGTNKCTNFVNMETSTNPIDRTIVHLLYHRPSDSSAILNP